MGSSKYNNEFKFFGFCSCVTEVFVLVGCDTTSEGNWYLTFQDTSGPSSGVGMSKNVLGKKVHHTCICTRPPVVQNSSWTSQSTKMPLLHCLEILEPVPQ